MRTPRFLKSAFFWAYLSLFFSVLSLALRIVAHVQRSESSHEGRVGRIAECLSDITYDCRTNCPNEARKVCEGVR